MSESVISVQNLGKKYHLGGPSRSTTATLRDQLARLSLRGLLKYAERVEHRPTFWALKDVSFEVKQGELVGVIGGNGAGKSTLLKILSQITEPTRGSAEIRGRVGSLLEVGTGFHPDLTGRENIYLNGAILGMRRREIARKFDEIVEFAGVERFLDTAVKHYSSGMHTRLAFSVSAHLEPEILIVDEVLAVGDTNFQRKCLNKMESVSGTGRTVLFVSHSMATVQRLCPRAIMLHQGNVLADGPADEITRVYLQSGLGMSAFREWTDPATAPGSPVARLVSVRIRDEAGNPTSTSEIQSPIGIDLTFDTLEAGHVLVPSARIMNEAGQCVFLSMNHEPDWNRKPRPAGRYCCTLWIPGNFMAEGVFNVSPAVATLAPERVHFYVPDAVSFQVVDKMLPGGVRGDYVGNYPGLVRPKLSWETKTLYSGSSFGCTQTISHATTPDVQG